jgi:hypothetical protein
MTPAGPGPERTENDMLWTIIVVLFALWLLGIIASIGGGAIHLLLLIAGIILIAQLVSGRRTVS